MCTLYGVAVFKMKRTVEWSLSFLTAKESERYGVGGKQQATDKSVDDKNLKIENYDEGDNSRGDYSC